MILALYDGYAPHRESVAVREERGQDFCLEPAARISGRVVTAAGGDPVPGAEVHADLPEPDGLSLIEAAITDETGSFRFTTLPAGSYLVSARKGSMAGTIGKPTDVVSTGQVENVEVAISPGLTIKGTVKSVRGTPIAGARLNVWPRRRGANGPRTSLGVLSDPSGRYTIEGILADDYTAMVWADGHVPEVSKLSVTGNTAHDFVLSEGLTIIGRVIEYESGQPLPGVTVQVRSRTPLPPRVTTDATGGFELHGVPADPLPAVSVDSEQQTHISTMAPPAPVRDGRMDLGTIKLLKVDPNKP